MKITLHVADGDTRIAKQPHDHASHVVCDGPCPACNVEGPLKVQGMGNHVEDRETYAAKALALCCRKYVGILRVRVSTIFGIEEDQRIQSGQFGRVY